MNKSREKNKRTATVLIYAVGVVSLILLTVIIAVGSAANRTVNRGENSGEKLTENNAGNVGEDSVSLPKDPPESDKPSGEESGNDSQEATPPEDDPPEDTGSEDVDAPVVDKLPEFSQPLDGVITKPHSKDTLVYSMTMNDYRVHNGIDIEASLGEGVCAVADGVVGEIWQDPLMGWSISVIHSGEAVSTYRNLSEEFPEGIKKGSAVKSGDIIASVGESALIESADEVHLHFELSVGGINVDPDEYFTLSTSAEPEYEG